MGLEAAPSEKSGHLQLLAPLLASGQQLEERFGQDLGEPLRAFVAAASNADAVRRARETRRTHIVIGASLAAAVVMTLLAAGALWQRREAVVQKQRRSAISVSRRRRQFAGI